MTDWTEGPIPDDESDGMFMYVRWNHEPPMAVKVEGPYTLTVIRAFIEHEWAEFAWVRLPDLPTDRGWMLRALRGATDPAPIEADPQMLSGSNGWVPDTEAQARIINETGA